MQAHRRVAAVLAVVALSACQDYPFEAPPVRRVNANKISEFIATVIPTDILFVVDNSDSMGEEISELQNNVGLFIEEMSKADNEFQVGMVTTDVECNIPGKDCPSGLTSVTCCSTNPTPCQDRDENSDTHIDSSDCDGGRLRAAAGGIRRIFKRPAPAEREQWVIEFKAAIEAARNNLKGSTFESGFEAARRAVLCSAEPSNCPDPAVADLNEGFIRPEADLVLIFLSDEEDCSVTDSTLYYRPNDPASATDQAASLCSPNDCYAHFGGDLDSDNNGIMDWVEAGLLTCNKSPTGTALRKVNPPPLTEVGAYLDELIALKGGDASRVRAAAVVGSVLDEAAALGARTSGCIGTLLGPSDACGCWTSTGGGDVYCQVTGSLGQSFVVQPPGPTGGCLAMPGGRYMSFLEQLAERRVAAGTRADTLVDSICKGHYDDTLYKIVNTVILTNCFALGQAPDGAEDILVLLNGERLPHVAVRGPDRGWSWIPKKSEICLEGGLKKALNDKFEILVITSDS